MTVNIDRGTRATVTTTETVAYTAYREVEKEVEVEFTSKIEVIKEVRQSGIVMFQPERPLKEAKDIVDALWEKGYRVVKIVE